MQKTYIAPTLVEQGRVVATTLGKVTSSSEGQSPRF